MKLILTEQEARHLVNLLTDYMTSNTNYLESTVDIFGNNEVTTAELMRKASISACSIDEPRTESGTLD